METTGAGHLLVFVSLLVPLRCEGGPKYEQIALRRAGEGEQMLTQIRRYGEHPRYGKCWTTALQQIQEGCKRLTDDEQSFLALSFANCHLEKAGQPTYPCESARDIVECLRPLADSPLAFNAYTEFFTHTQDICFFLQSQVWHEQTEETVSRLARSSEDVALKMEASGQLQEEMIEKQGASIKQQELILQNEERLRDALHSSSQDIKNVFAEMKESTQTQRHLFEETFSRVGEVQRLVLGEFTWFSSLLFFAVAALLAYLLTASPRTAGARLPLFLLLGLDWVVERAACRLDGTHQEILYQRMWLCRKVFCSTALLVLGIFAYRYKDMAKANNALLLEIRRQNSELVRAIKAQSTGAYPALGSSSIAGALQSASPAALSVGINQKLLSYGGDYCDSSPTGKLWPAVAALGGQRAEGVSRLDTYSSEDLTSSDSDPTYVGRLSSGEEEEGVSDAESFCTAYAASRPASRRASFDRRSSTPQPMAAFRGDVSDGFIHTDGSGGGKRKPGRPKGSKSRQTTPLTPSGRAPSQSRYNLRTRTPRSADNSILSSETVEMFMERVGVALGRRRYRAERVDPATHSSQRRNLASFSSDDEF